MAYAFLAAAIVSEIIGTTATRQSEGFSRFLPSAIALVGVVAAYVLLSRSLQHGMGIGAAYAIWSAVGLTVVALIGTFLGDRLNWTQAAGIALIIGGVLAVELGGTGESAP